VEFRILGPLEVLDDGRDLTPARAKQRVLLAMLLLHANDVVARDQLIDALWGETPPPSAQTALHGHVSALRKLLGSDRIETRSPGYLLRLSSDELDLSRFEALVTEASEQPDPEARAARLRSALALWRGEPLIDLRYESFAQSEIARLEELRLSAVELRIDIDLAQGRPADVIPELEQLVAEHPFRERLRGQLMLALYRCGRQADALEIYRGGRRTLAEELGLEPSPKLQQLERAILAHEPALEPSKRGRGQEDEEVPSLRTLHRTNLPSPSTPFIGRERELEAVVQLLSREEVRLVTLTGAGGSGKTRLALQVAEAASGTYLDGIFWVPLASLREADLVLETAREALGAGVELGEHLGARSTLLLFDNFEHVIDAAGGIAALLSSCPNLNVLVTSRERLHLSGEHEYPVAPLTHDDAVSLFVARAKAVDPSFKADEAVSEICRRIDQLPLAVELAAARVKALSPSEIARRLERRLPLLTGGGRDLPERQRTLRATIQWSYELLTSDEQRLLARLAPFAGGCTFEGAEQVAEADVDTIHSLVEKSLLRHTSGRYSMLESVREYAMERLDESHEREKLHLRLAEYLVTFVERSDLTAAERTRLVPVLREELDNLRAAVAFLIQVGETKLALRLARRAHFFSATPREQTRWLDDALRHSDGLPEKLHVDALAARARAAFVGGDFESAARFGQDALEGYRRLGAAAEESRALRRLGRIAGAIGDVDQARTLLNEALEKAEQAVDQYYGLHALAQLELQVGDLDASASLFSRSADLAREADDRRLMTNILHATGDVALAQNDLDRAGASYCESLRLCSQLDFVRGPAYCVAGLAAAAARAGDTQRAGELWGAVETLERDLGFPILPHEKARYEEDVLSHAAAASDAFAAAFAAGQEMSVDDIYTHVLGERVGSLKS
jgi:predicted ATPase/DNA-binding SARP family transcriptional activator